MKILIRFTLIIFYTFILHMDYPTTYASDDEKKVIQETPENKNVNDESKDTSNKPKRKKKIPISSNKKIERNKKIKKTTNKEKSPKKTKIVKINNSQVKNQYKNALPFFKIEYTGGSVPRTIYILGSYHPQQPSNLITNTNILSFIHNLHENSILYIEHNSNSSTHWIDELNRVTQLQEHNIPRTWDNVIMEHDLEEPWRLIKDEKIYNNTLRVEDVTKLPFIEGTLCLINARALKYMDYNTTFEGAVENWGWNHPVRFLESIQDI